MNYLRGLFSLYLDFLELVVLAILFGFVTLVLGAVVCAIVMRLYLWVS